MLMQESFLKAVDHGIFLLNNTCLRYNRRIMFRVANLVMKLRPNLKELNFDKIRPISILSFMTEFNAGRGSIDDQQGVATRLISYVSKKPALPWLQSRLSSRKICASKLHNGSLSPHVKNVFCFLITYSTDNTKLINKGFVLLQTRPRSIWRIMCTEAIYQGIVDLKISWRKFVKSPCNEGLDKWICNNRRVLMTNHPNAPWQN